MIAGRAKARIAFKGTEHGADFLSFTVPREKIFGKRVIRRSRKSCSGNIRSTNGADRRFKRFRAACGRRVIAA
jgi:hypothetical protein